MKKINKEFAANYLYRIFVYGGDARQYDSTVRAFQEFLQKKGIEYSARMLYDYAEGATPFPAALLPYLIEFSKDRQLISLLLPPLKAATRDLLQRYQAEEEDLKEKMASIKRAKEELEEQIGILKRGEACTDAETK